MVARRTQCLNYGENDDENLIFLEREPPFLELSVFKMCEVLMAAHHLLRRMRSGFSSSTILGSTVSISNPHHLLDRRPSLTTS